MFLDSKTIVTVVTCNTGRSFITSSAPLYFFPLCTVCCKYLMQFRDTFSDSDIAQFNVVHDMSEEYRTPEFQL